MVTSAQLKKLFPKAKPALVKVIVDNWSMAEAKGITNRKRKSDFFAQIGTETGELSSVSESLNYSVEGLRKTFGRHRISDAQCQALGRKVGRPADQEGIANVVYGGAWGKANLGNTKSGDGWLYRGGGMMQTTGRAGYRAMGFENNPDALRDPLTAFITALREWEKRGCNARADRGDVAGNRKAINGGENGLDHCKEIYARALTIFPEQVSIIIGKGGAPKPKPVPTITPPRAEEPVTQAEVEAAIEIVETEKAMVKLPSGPELLAIQQMLDDKGWHMVGTVDGDWGDNTELAAFAFRNEQNPKLLPLDGGIDRAFIAALKASPGRKIGAARVATTAKDLDKKGDETTLTTRDLITGAGALGGTAAVGGVDQQGTLDKAKQALDGFDIAQEVATRALGGVQWILQHWWMPVLAIAVYMAWKAWKVRRLREQAHQTARDVTF